MKNSKVLTIFSTFFSCFLSIILIFLTVFMPFYFSVTAFTRAEAIVRIVQNIRYETIIKESEPLNSTLEEFGVNTDTLDETLKSEQAAKLISVYADNAIEILMDTPTNKEFDVPTVRNLIVENIDGFLDAAEKNSGKALPKEELKAQIVNTITGNTEVVETVIPVLEPLRVVIETVKASKLLQNTLKPTFAIILFAGLIFIVASIIFLQPKLKNGTLWLGSSFLISAALLLATIIYSKSAFLKMIAERVSAFEAEILTSTLNISREKLNLGFFISAILALICFGIYIGYFIYKRHKNKNPR